jgi:tRNA G18 (ribose-2'-O)-methylase SpoU
LKIAQKRICFPFLGNEATGLDEEKYTKMGIGIKIPQSGLVDSLNISIAAGIDTFIFAQKNRLI